MAVSQGPFTERLVAGEISIAQWERCVTTIAFVYWAQSVWVGEYILHPWGVRGGVCCAVRY
jgi:hypothetical protein